MPNNPLISQLRSQLRRLHTSPGYTGLRRLVASLRRQLRRLRHQLHPSTPFGSRHATRSARALRRFVSLWRRRGKPGGNGRP